MIQFSMQLSHRQISLLRAIYEDNKREYDADRTLPVFSGYAHFLSSIKMLLSENLVGQREAPTKRNPEHKEWYVTGKGLLVLELVAIDIAEAAGEASGGMKYIRSANHIPELRDDETANKEAYLLARGWTREQRGAHTMYDHQTLLGPGAPPLVGLRRAYEIQKNHEEVNDG